MKLLAFTAIIASATAAPIEIVGKITKEVACKDYVDSETDPNYTGYIEDCTNPDSIYRKCQKSASLPDEASDSFYTAASWDEAVEKCTGAFTTEDAGDKRCLQVIYYDGALGADEAFECEAYLTAAQAEELDPVN